VSPTLQVSALRKRYGELEALAGVSFEVRAGELLAVLGPNGAGKTTLLSLLAGAQRPDSGSVSVAPAQVGWAPQQPALYSKLTVAENLELFARLEGVSEPARVVERMLEQTGLQARSGERAGRLSGGNRQRVNVAIGLLGDPPVLALDEPTASLDSAQRGRLWAFLAEVARGGRAVLFSTHDAHEAQRHADRVLVLDEGRLLFDGTPAELMARSTDPGSADLDGALAELLARAHGPAAEGSEP
jgi:ABC-2 type transport system ATP-binding protein